MSVFISDLKKRFHRKKHVFGSIVGVPRIEYENELAEELVLERDNKRKTWSVCFHLSHQESLIDYYLSSGLAVILFGTMIQFMRRLIKDVGRKVFLIVNNLRVHHSQLVREWLEDHRAQIEVFYLPSYSPELNPDECLNCDLKVWVHAGVPATSKSELARKAIGHLRMLQKRPARVEKYFKHPKIAYAA